MALGITVTKTPFRKPSDKENFDTSYEITIDEWDELFLKALEVPEIKPSKGEPHSDFQKRREKMFQEFLTGKGYKMMGRIWYVFRDAFYLPSEVDKLLQECVKIQRETQNELALSALKKLIFACHEALEVKSGVWLVSD